MDVLDTFGRPLRDLRISVTDRCNMRCTYCMPREVFGPDFVFVPREELLTFEELERLAGLFVGLGVQKVRITGGEPLIRRDVPVLVTMLRAVGPELDLAMTSNAVLLPRYSTALAEAGLDRVTVSLDALDDETFARITDSRSTVDQVMEGIAAAEASGLGPVKINAVVVRGVNEDQIIPMANRFRGTGRVVRFIEYMDVGTTNGWRLDQVVPAVEVIDRIHAVFPIEPVEASYRGEVAERWRYRDGAGEVGVIASVTRPFCGDCTRIRLSADGQLFTCLFASRGHDLKAPLRSGGSDDELIEIIAGIWARREDRYSELRTSATVPFPKVEMSYIGG